MAPPDGIEPSRHTALRPQRFRVMVCGDRSGYKSRTCTAPRERRRRVGRLCRQPIRHSRNLQRLSVDRLEVVGVHRGAQSANIAARPFLSAHRTTSCWNPNSAGLIATAGSTDTVGTAHALLARNSSYPITLPPSRSATPAVPRFRGIPRSQRPSIVDAALARSHAATRRGDPARLRVVCIRRSIAAPLRVSPRCHVAGVAGRGGESS